MSYYLVVCLIHWSSSFVVVETECIYALAVHFFSAIKVLLFYFFSYSLIFLFTTFFLPLRLKYINSFAL